MNSTEPAEPGLYTPPLALRCWEEDLGRRTVAPSFADPGIFVTMEQNFRWQSAIATKANLAPFLFDIRVRDRIASSQRVSHRASPAFYPLG